MNKNEELQKWLNDDRYVQAKELEIMWNVGRGGVGDFLRSRKIKNVKKIGTRQGVYVFYDKQQCVNARAIYNAKIQELQNWLNDTKFIQKQELVLKWGVTVSAVSSFLYNRNIKSIKKIHNGGAISYAFYDRAECERARPFINQPKKEVEKVENIGELATATKHQILSETGADNFVWDKVTMKHKIMPVKNYCDERGNFVSLFKKDEAVSAILAYKNEQKQLLEKCLADKNLVTTTDLAKIWNTNKKSIYNKIYRLKIKPYAKVKLENGNIWHFYKKSDCIESQDVEKVEQNELPKMKQETAETMPDIIPADTIDLFTMSELESELNKRGVELTDEVKEKINASDMPEMQHIATMIRGNAKTIAIRLSVLNEIAGQLREVELESIVENKGIPVDVFKYYKYAETFYVDRELKPCPFCGTNSIEINCENIGDHWQAMIMCRCCLIKKHMSHDDKKIAAAILIEEWNERPTIEDCAKTKMGAKSKYKPEFDKIAFDMAAANKTDIEICEQLNISAETFYRYKKEIASFANALNSGRAANPFIITDSQGREKADRYFELKDFMEMQKQLNDMQKMIEKLVEKLDGANVTEKKMFIKNGKIDKVVVTEAKLEDKK